MRSEGTALEVRPIVHRTEDRVRLPDLSLADHVKWHMERGLAPLHLRDRYEAVLRFSVHS